MNPDRKLPESLAWYRESAQWILTLALGTLTAFGGLAGFSDKLAQTPDAAKYLYLSGGFLLVLTVVAGVLHHTWLAQYGNLLEHREDYRNRPEGEEKTKLLAKNEAERRGVLSRAGTAYVFLIWGFFISLVPFSISGAWLLLRADEGADKNRYEWAVQPDCQPFANPKLYVLQKSSGRIFYYSLTADTWIRVAGPIPKEPH